jgi:glycosyltransferase involved in cell wall biosynthesis
MKKIVIIVTVPVVLETWLKGQAFFLSKNYDIEIITAYSETVKDIEKYENVSIKIMDLTRQINIFKDIKVLLQLFFYLLKNRPFMVYSLTPKAGLLGMISSWMARVPNRVHNVVGLPHLEATGKRKFVLTTTEKITYFFSSKLYCNSINLKKVIETMTKKSVKVIGKGSVNGVDTKYFNNSLFKENKLIILNKLKFKDNDFIITFVGRIVKDKGINELINVFNILYKKYPDIKLLLIGDYKNESDPISLQSQDIIKNNKSIKYLEFQEDVREYLSISSLFVLPSYREGLPNVLIEAGSFGIPLIATNINGCNEIINDGINGLLVNKKDENDLSNAIERFIKDEEFYISIKNNVRKSIINRYEQQYFWSELLSEFKRIETIK